MERFEKKSFLEKNLLKKSFTFQIWLVKDFLNKFFFQKTFFSKRSTEKSFWDMHLKKISFRPLAQFYTEKKISDQYNKNFVVKKQKTISPRNAYLRI